MEVTDAMHDAGVRQALAGLWRVLRKEKDGQVTQETMTQLCARICKALVSECSDEVAVAMAKQSTRFMGELSHQQVCRWLVELAQLYCATDQPKEAAAFLVGLKLRICTATGGQDDGSSAELVPTMARVDAEHAGALWDLQCAQGLTDKWRPLAAPNVGEATPGSQIALLVRADGIASAPLRILEERLAPLSAVSLLLRDKPKLAAELWNPRAEAQHVPGGTLMHALIERFPRANVDSDKLAHCGRRLRERVEQSIVGSGPSSGPSDAALRVLHSQQRALLQGALAAGSHTGKLPRVWVVGPPQTGKSSVARSLAAATGATLLEGTSALTREDMRKALTRGTGYVLDGGHMCSQLTELVQVNADVAPLQVVSLVAEPEDLADRVASIRVDSRTGKRYLGAEWRHEKALFEEEQERKRAKQAARAARDAARAARAAAGEEVGEEEEEEEEEGGEGGEGGEAQEDVEGTNDKPLAFDPEFLEPVPDARPADEVVAQVRESLSALQHVEGDFVRADGAPRSVLRVSASQDLESIEDQVFYMLADANLRELDLALPRPGFLREYLQARPLFPPEPPIRDDEEEDGKEENLADDSAEPDAEGKARTETEAVAITEAPEESPMETETDEEVQRRAEILFNVGLSVPAQRLPASSETEGNPVSDEAEEEDERIARPAMYSFRHLSKWGFVCPVTWERGQSLYAVLYLGHVYFCATRVAMGRFLETPSKFANKPRGTAGRVLLVGEQDVKCGQLESVGSHLAAANNWSLIEGVEDDAGLRMLASTLVDEHANRWVLTHHATGAIRPGSQAPAGNSSAAEADGGTGEMKTSPTPTGTPEPRPPTPEEYLRELGERKAVPRAVVLLVRAQEPVAGEENALAQAAEKSNELAAWQAAAEAKGIVVVQVQVTASQTEEDIAAGLTEQLQLQSSGSLRAVEAKFLAAVGEDAALVDSCLGWSGKFCPVTLVSQGRLVPGSAARTQFHGKSFFRMASDQALEAFKADPSHFVDPRKELLHRPKPIIWILGPSGSGRSTVAEQLHRAEGLNVLDRQSFEAFQAERAECAAAKAAAAVEKVPPPAEDALAPAEGAEADEAAAGENMATPDAQAEGSEELAVPATSSDDLLIEYIEQCAVAFKSSGYVIDGLIETEEHLDRLVARQLHPSLVLELRVDEEVAVKRTMERHFRWEYTAPVPAEPTAEEGESTEPAETEAPPPPTEEELQQMEEEARAAFLERVQQEIAAVAQASETIAARLRGEGVEAVPAVDMSGRTSLTHVLRRLKAKVRERCVDSPMLNAGRAQVVDARLCKSMLDAGLVVNAPLGSYCAVTRAESGRLVRTDVPGRPERGTRIVFDGYAYCVLAEHVSAFRARPSWYAQQASEVPGTRVRPRCAVLGAPLVGKTSLAEKIRDSSAAVVVSPAAAIRSLVDSVDPHSGLPSSLSQQLRGVVPSGNDQDWAGAVDPGVVTKCVARLCRAKDAAVNGYVLDNFPQTGREYDLLAEVGELPDVFIWLSDLSMEELSPRIAQRGCDASVVFKGFAARRAAALEMKTHLEASLLPRCLYLDPKSSLWSLHRTARERLDQASDGILDVLGHEPSGNDPHDAAPESGCTLALDALDLIGLGDGGFVLQTGSHCAVHFLEHEGELAATSSADVVLHKGRLFGVKDEGAKQRFLDDPERYIAIEEALLAKVDALPPSPAELLESCRRIEYLETTLAPLLCQGLELLGTERLKHPCLSTRSTCLKFLSLFLRASNAGVPEYCQQERKRVMNMFTEECRLFGQISSQAACGTGLMAVRRKKQEEEGEGTKAGLAAGESVTPAATSATDEAAFARWCLETDQDLVSRFQKLLRQSSSILAARIDIR